MYDNNILQNDLHDYWNLTADKEDITASSTSTTTSSDGSNANMITIPTYIRSSVISRNTDLYDDHDNYHDVGNHDGRRRDNNSNDDDDDDDDVINDRSYNNENINMMNIKEMINCMGMIYELDCITMSWRSPIIIMDILSMYQETSSLTMNINLHITYYKSMMESIKERIAQSIIVIYPKDINYYCCDKCFLRNHNPYILCQCKQSSSSSSSSSSSLKIRSTVKTNKKISSTSITFDSSDLATYGNKDRNNDNHDKDSKAGHDDDDRDGRDDKYSTDDKDDDGDDDDDNNRNFNRYQPCWFIQFGGYCSKSEIVKNDLYALNCVPTSSRLPPSSTSSTSTSSASTSSHSKSYKYYWRKLTATGTVPTPRHSHSSVVIPSQNYIQIKPNYNQPIVVGATDCSDGSRGNNDIFRYKSEVCTRIIYYGGVIQTWDLPNNHNRDEVLSLRINSNYAVPSSSSSSSLPPLLQSNTSHSQSYLHWEIVQITGISPPKRQSHTMVYLPNCTQQTCLIFGGYLEGTRSCANDLWCLVIYDVEQHYIIHRKHNVMNTRSRSSTNYESVISMYWLRVETSGIPPSPRARHVSFIRPITNRNSSSRSDAESCDMSTYIFFIFGGSDETKIGRHNIYDPQLDYDEGQKDSIMHQSHVQILTKLNNNLIPMIHTVRVTWLAKESKSSSSSSTSTSLSMPVEQTRLPQQLLLSSSASSSSFEYSNSWLLHYPLESYITSTPCTLSYDMLSLLAPLFDTSQSPTYRHCHHNDADSDCDIGRSDKHDDNDKNNDSYRRIHNIIRAFNNLRDNSTNSKNSNSSSRISNSSYNDLALEIVDGHNHITKLMVSSSLLTSRCSWILALLNSNMIESQHKIIRFNHHHHQHQNHEKQDNNKSNSNTMINSCDNKYSNNDNNNKHDAWIFKLLLIYLYSDIILYTNITDVISMLELGNIYNIDKLSKKCEGILVRLITLSNVFEMLDYADNYNLLLLKDICVSELICSDYINILVNFWKSSNTDNDDKEDEKYVHCSDYDDSADDEHVGDNFVVFSGIGDNDDNIHDVLSMNADDHDASVENTSSHQQSLSYSPPSKVLIEAAFKNLNVELQEEIKLKCLFHPHVYMGYINASSS